MLEEKIPIILTAMPAAHIGNDHIENLLEITT